MPTGGASVLQNPTIQAIAANHNRSAAQIVLNYQVSRNISVNPGFAAPGDPGYQPMDKVVEYMQDNLHFFDFDLDEEERQQIANLSSSR